MLKLLGANGLWGSVNRHPRIWKLSWGARSPDGAGHGSISTEQRLTSRTIVTERPLERKRVLRFNKELKRECIARGKVEVTGYLELKEAPKGFRDS